MGSVFRCSHGRVAIWTGEGDTDPFFNPKNNMNRVKFHSDLDYVTITKVLNKTVTIPAIPSSGSGQGDPGVRAQSYSLGGHGVNGTPFIVGIITVSGEPMAFTGSVLVHHRSAPNASSIDDSFGRFLALGADASQMYVHEYAVQPGNKQTGIWSSRPAQTFHLTLGITNVRL